MGKSGTRGTNWIRAEEDGAFWWEVDGGYARSRRFRFRGVNGFDGGGYNTGWPSCGLWRRRAGSDWLCGLVGFDGSFNDKGRLGRGMGRLCGVIGVGGNVDDNGCLGAGVIDGGVVEVGGGCSRGGVGR